MVVYETWKKQNPPLNCGFKEQKTKFITFKPINERNSTNRHKVGFQALKCDDRKEMKSNQEIMLNLKNLRS